MLLIIEVAHDTIFWWNFDNTLKTRLVNMSPFVTRRFKEKIGKGSWKCFTFIVRSNWDVSARNARDYFPRLVKREDFAWVFFPPFSLCFA